MMRRLPEFLCFSVTILRISMRPSYLPSEVVPVEKILPYVL